MTSKPGSYVFRPAKLPHTANCVSTTPCLVFISYDAPMDVTLAPE